MALLPSCGGGGGSGGAAAALDATLSTLSATPGFGALANGSHAVEVTVTVLDTAGNPAEGRTVQLSVTGSGNAVVQPPATDANGMATGQVTTTFAEKKNVTAVVDPGPTQVALAAVAVVEFVPHDPDARYVRAGGSDLDDGLSPATAWATIGKAALSAAPGHLIHVGGGTYRENVVVTASGAPGSPITFRADPAGKYTGDPGEVVVDAWSGPASFQLDGVSDVVVEGFTLVGAVPGTGPGGAVHVGENPCSDVVVRDSVVYGSDRGIFVSGGSDVTLERNRVSNNLGVPGDGITIRGGARVTVRGNLVYNVFRHGILVEGGAQQVALEINTLYANGGDQVRVDASGNDVVSMHNVVSEGLSDGFSLAAGSAATSDRDLVWGHAGENWKGLAPGLASISADPLFESPAGPDGLLGGANGADDQFHVDESSPAVDAGEKRARAYSFSDGTSLAEHSTRLDRIADGTAPDGKKLNLGYHYAAVPSIPPPTGGEVPEGTASAASGEASNTVVFWAPGVLRAPPGLEDPRMRAGGFSWNVRAPGALSLSVLLGGTSEAVLP